MSTYIPRRDHRFDNVGDVIYWVEENQCGTCIFREQEDDTDELMCVEVALPLIVEHPNPLLEDMGSDGVYCTKWRSADPQFDNHESFTDPDQLTLFEE